MTGWLKRLSWIEIGILVIAVALRIALLDIKPAHFDEGVNGWFADQMERTGYFRYDPTNYHGPLHFYALFLSQTLFGRNLWALRLPAILASVLAVWAALCFREHFGRHDRADCRTRDGGLACLCILRPLFDSRILAGLFSLVFCWGLLGLWTKGERRFLFMLFAGATGMILTKETYILHIGSFVLAGAVLGLIEKILPSQPARCHLVATLVLGRT